MPGMFISYRRDDSGVQSPRLYDRLIAHFGCDSVFMDVDTIPFGVDFRDHLEDAVSRCDVLLAVIGPTWLQRNNAGRRRLDDANDFVRFEIETALRGNKRVIPVLIAPALVPKESELPETLRELAYRNAVKLDPGQDFDSDVDRLIRGLEASTIQPEYSIHSPDVLRIEVAKMIPRVAHRLEPGDEINIEVKGTIPDEPIAGLYAVEIDGTIDLTLSYGGKLKVSGMTLEEAKLAIDKQLRQILKLPLVNMRLSKTTPLPPIRGEYPVGPDGLITLGVFGQVHVDGRSIREAKFSIELHLANYLLRPEVQLEVAAFKSMVCDVHIHRADSIVQTHALPISGRLTVTNVLSQLGELPPINRIQIINPKSKRNLEVNWEAICGGDFSTDRQIMRGDRIVVYANDNSREDLNGR